MATNRNTSRKADAPRIVISGGGTGGHIFPAVSIAGAVRTLCPQAEILFVGAEGRMEMQRVPEAGYPIIGLPVAGFDRSHLWRNVAVVRKLLGSLWQARRIVRDFRPHVAVGVGGYASGPTLYMASRMGVPTLLQEQNSYAGVTNRLLAKRASKICVAYDGMEAFFPKDKILLTGNPVRQNLLDGNLTRAEAAAAFGLDPALKTVLVVGGQSGSTHHQPHRGGHVARPAPASPRAAHLADGQGLCGRGKAGYPVSHRGRTDWYVHSGACRACMYPLSCRTWPGLTALPTW